MKRAAMTCLALGALALAGSCAGTDIGAEYVEVSEEESQLVFCGPGLAGGFRRFLTGQDGHFVRRTVGEYGPKQGEFPFALIFFSETPPNRHFASVPRVRETVKNWGWFNNKTVEIGSSGATVNTIGRIDYATVTADGIACVVWLQTSGPREGAGVGTQVLSGFYCRGEGPMMSAEQAESVVRLVGHWKYGAVEPPAGWRTASSVRIQVIWGNGSAGVDRFDGQIGFHSGRGRGFIKIATGGGRDCEGDLDFDRTKNDKIVLRWSVTCGDGVTASGDLTIRTINGTTYLSGGGEDSRGRNVAIID